MKNGKVKNFLVNVKSKLAIDATKICSKDEEGHFIVIKVSVQ